MSNLSIYENKNNHNELQKSTLIKQVEFRKKSLFDEGKQIVGVLACNTHKAPDWFDKQAFKKAQKLYHTYGAAFTLNQLYGFLFSLNHYDGFTFPTVVTGHSATVSTHFLRFLSFTVHVNHWFTGGEPFDVNSTAYRSLKIVKGIHSQMSKKINDALPAGLNSFGNSNHNANEVWLSQYAMVNAQFVMIGLQAIYPNALGLGTLSSDDKHCLYHFWRVVGHCLGIEDRFNLCDGSDEEIEELCRQIYYKEWKPKIIENATKKNSNLAVTVGKDITLGIFRFFPVFTYNSLMHYGALHFDLNQAGYKLTTLWDYFYFYLLSLSIKGCSKSVIIMWTKTQIFFAFKKIAFWCKKIHLWNLMWKYPLTKNLFYYHTFDDRSKHGLVNDINYKLGWEYRLK